MPSLQANRGAKRAREARAALGLGLDDPLPCVVETVERLGGVPVFVLDLGEGLAGAFRPVPPLIFVNLDQAVVRQRFTVAHEFGHHWIGHAELKILDGPDDIGGRGGDPMEVEANAFAAEFLAPRQGVLRAFEQDGPTTVGLEVVCRIALRFGLSAIAALYRLEAAKLVTPPVLNRLRSEIDEGLHQEVVAWLDPEPFDDELQRAAEDGRVRIPEAMRGSALAGLLTGELTLEQAAERAGRSPRELQAALEACSI